MARVAVVAALVGAGLTVASPAQAIIITCSKAAISPEGAQAFCTGSPPHMFYVSITCLRLPTGQKRIVNGPHRPVGYNFFSRAYCGSGWVLYSYTYFTYS
ncbi:hypothetical protein Rhe02_17520 [Rhizocola hellebori]|uniref:Secreted protein n=1 Tax=Rhizocola hellebori TaxID=1392758 RepID=A0A8J3VEM3_9ACTN|nr:hypothetical protein Rhe02_17520 [Rhizocola hellebori]